MFSLAVIHLKSFIHVTMAYFPHSFLLFEIMLLCLASKDPESKHQKSKTLKNLDRTSFPESSLPRMEHNLSIRWV
jgi:hypothetical protein